MIVRKIAVFVLGLVCLQLGFAGSAAADSGRQTFVLSQLPGEDQIRVTAGGPIRGVGIDVVVNEVEDHQTGVITAEDRFESQEGRREEAWAEFSRFAHDGFTSPPVDSQWLFGVAALAETCSLLDEPTRAEALFELLVPFAERMVVLDAFGGGGGFLGPVAHHLGLLGATLGRRTEAEAHFHAAIEVAVRFGATPWAARAQTALEQLDRERTATGESR